LAEVSHIGWTNGTWNPWYGCTKISPGCKFCYMYRDMERYGRDPFTVQRSKTTFNAPLKWKEPRMIFTCSWSDFFIENADAWRDEAWDIIRRTPHTYQILTKRPELIDDRLPVFWDEIKHRAWLGVSVENADYAHRIGSLLNSPAGVTFVSLEPILGPVEISVWLPDLINPDRFLDWVIVGGESGADGIRRDCDPRWICDIVDQCRVAKTPVFVKQDSGSKPGLQRRIPDSHWVQEFPA
jgi:protein gp37